MVQMAIPKFRNQVKLAVVGLGNQTILTVLLHSGWEPKVLAFKPTYRVKVASNIKEKR